MEGKRPVFVGVAAALVILAGLVYYFTSRSATPAQINLELPDEITAGQEIAVPLRISTNQAMNAAEFYFSFPADLLEVKSIDKTGSIYQLWITDYPQFDNKKGTISFAGGLPTPGFSGKNGLVGTVHFYVKASGNGKITLDSEQSRVLANDGEGTEIMSVFAPVEITVR